MFGVGPIDLGGPGGPGAAQTTNIEDLRSPKVPYPPHPPRFLRIHEIGLDLASGADFCCKLVCGAGPGFLQVAEPTPLGFEEAMQVLSIRPDKEHSRAVVPVTNAPPSHEVDGLDGEADGDEHGEDGLVVHSRAN